MSNPRSRSSEAPRRRRPPSVNAMTAMLVIVLPLSLFFLQTAIVLGVGMLPTMVAYVTDRNDDKSAAITVGALNFVGCMIFVIHLWQHENTVAGAMRILGNPFAWFAMYGGAGVGWGLYYGIPPMVAVWIASRARGRIESFKERQRALAEEWGEEVRGDKVEDETI